MKFNDKMELIWAICECRTIASILLNDGSLSARVDSFKSSNENLMNIYQEYKFFNGLHQQSDLDNVLSLMKIIERLGFEMPNVKIDLQNIKGTCDKLWEEINEEIILDKDMVEEIREIIEITLESEDRIPPSINNKLHNAHRITSKVLRRGIYALYDDMDFLDYDTGDYVWVRF